jgi:hypothetical protein
MGNSMLKWHLPHRMIILTKIIYNLYPSWQIYWWDIIFIKVMPSTHDKALLKMLNQSVKIILNHTITNHNTFIEKGRKHGSWM